MIAEGTKYPCVNALIVCNLPNGPHRLTVTVMKQISDSRSTSGVLLTALKGAQDSLKTVRCANKCRPKLRPQIFHAPFSELQVSSGNTINSPS